MKLLIRASICYFPLAFVYKALCPELKEVSKTVINYWVNYFWFITSIWLMLVFIGVFKCIPMFSGIYDRSTVKLYKYISLVVAGYWAVMTLLRLYLFFNIKQHYQLIDKAGLLGFGTVSIIIILTFLTFKSWFRK
jgi:hypothetical protein